MITLADVIKRPKHVPLVIAYGLGVDSHAILVELARRKVRPDKILFADVGKGFDGKPNEKPQTYDYLHVAQAFCRHVGFPAIEIVHKRRVVAPDDTLFENCMRCDTLPSICFGYKGCSMKWKREPQDSHCLHWEPAKRCWDAGERVIKIIGYDAGPADMRRCNIPDDDRYIYYYPLREWGWARPRCIHEISQVQMAGWNPDNERGEHRLYWVTKGGVPIKSACFFCGAAKVWEVERLARTDPDLFKDGIRLEDNALHGKHGLRSTKGIGRNWAWRALAERGCLPLPIVEQADVEEAELVAAL